MCRVLGLGKEDKRKLLQATEMRILRMICVKTLREGMSDMTICDVKGEEKIKKYLREQRLLWFKHLQRLDDEKSLKNAKAFVVDCLKKDRRKKSRKKL